MEFSLYEIFWYFVIYAVLGWVVEVCFCSIKTGSFVNRGFLNGPVCPIYGFGMVAVLVCLWPLRNSMLVLYVGAVVLTSALELTTGWVLKKLFHTSWWDYSDMRFNLGGYICLRFSLIWGVGATLVVKLIHPAIAALVGVVPHMAGVVLAVPVTALFVCDLVITVLGIAHMNQDIGRIDDIVRAMRAGSDILAENIGDTALAVDRKVAGADTRAGSRNRQARNTLLRNREQNRASRPWPRLDLARAELMDSRRRVALRLMKAFPHMHSTRYTEGFERIRQWIEEEKRSRTGQKNDDAQ